LAGIPHVLGTFHVDSTYDLHRVRHGVGHRSLEVISNRCLDRAIAVSEATRKDWLQRTHIPADRVVTIHNGIDPEKFCRQQTREQARQVLNLPQDAMVIGGLGRLDEAKGFGDLITAAVLLRDEFPRMCVAIAGAGPLQSELEGQVERLGLNGVVRLVGFQRDVQVVLDALDVYAIPSLCEALPYALLEAMASELPVVGSAVGGIPEVIVEGETGFVVPARRPDRLAEQLRTLLLNDELRQRMGMAGRQRVTQHFHERDMLRKTIELYRQYMRPVQAINK
jgi:glycosyltransferase involved in cell wall biosynthesis